MASLNLVVLRSPDLKRAGEFYSLLGFEFTEHQHGKGPVHLAAELEGGGVFELYPLPENATPTIGTRIGFRVAELDSLVARIAAHGGRVLLEPKDSHWGRRAVVADPDGHKVELLQGA
jgi:predicted enzyme related to lactoylglutathione lyase